MISMMRNYIRVWYLLKSDHMSRSNLALKSNLLVTKRVFMKSYDLVITFLFFLNINFVEYIGVIIYNIVKNFSS